MSFKPFFPWCCDQELATCDICDRPVPTCLRVTIYDCESDYDYSYGDCDCRTFSGTYFVRGVQRVSRLYLRDPVAYCGGSYFEVQNACVWWGYVCNPYKRCGPEPCKRYDRVAVVLGLRVGGYDYQSIGYWLWIVFYDSQDAPHGLPGIPSKTSMLGTQLVIDGAWQFDETETGVICDDFTFTRSCGGQREPACIAGGDHCIDLSSCLFACRVRIEAIQCDQAALACESFPCESCCRGIRPNAVTVTLRNPPSELACLEGWPHDVPLVNNPDCTTPCVYKGEFLCDANYGYDKDGHIEVTVTRNANRGVIDINAYFRGARYQKTVDEACDSLTLIDLDYVSGKVDGDIDVSGTKLRIEANAGGDDVTADGFVGICDQECQPPQLLITIDGFSDIKSPFLGTFEFSRFNGDYVIRAGGSWGYLVYSTPTKCAAYGEILTINELLNSFTLWEQVYVELARRRRSGNAWNSLSFSLRNLTDNSQSFVMVHYSPESEHGEMPWDCEALDVTFTNTVVTWDGEVVRWPVTVRVRLL